MSRDFAALLPSWQEQSSCSSCVLGAREPSVGESMELGRRGERKVLRVLARE